MQTEGEEATQLSRRLEREKAHQDSTAGMSEDLSEGEKSSARGESANINLVDTIETWANEHKDKKLYIVLLRHVDSIAFELDNQCFICI